MELSLFSRDTIAMGTAIALSHDVFDGALLLGVCDKIVPGLLIGALHFGHLPCVFVPAGPMTSGLSNGDKAKVRERAAQGLVGRDALLAAESAAYHGVGTCTFYGTANSNQMLLEAMGLHVPGAAFVHPHDGLREALTREAVRQVLVLSLIHISWCRTHRHGEADPGPHLHRLRRLGRLQQAVDVRVGARHFGVLLQRLLQRLHDDALGRGRELDAGIGAAGVDLGDAVVALAHHPHEAWRRVQLGREVLDLPGDRETVGCRCLAALEQTQPGQPHHHRVEQGQPVAVFGDLSLIHIFFVTAPSMRTVRSSSTQWNCSAAYGR